MSRAPATFRQYDVTRAIKGAAAAGCKVKIKITSDGMEIIPITESAGAVVTDGDAAGALDAWRARRDQG